MAFNIKDLLAFKAPSLSKEEKDTLWSTIHARVSQGRPAFDLSAMFSALLWFPGRIALAGALVAMLLVGGGVSTIALAHEAKPGDFLFPVELAVEKVRLAITVDKKKDELRVAFAQKRYEEVRLVLAETAPLASAHGTTSTTSTFHTATSTPPTSTTTPVISHPRAQAALATALAHLNETRARLVLRGNTEAVSIIDGIIADITSLKNATSTAFVEAKIKTKIKDDEIKIDIKLESGNGNKSKIKIEVEEDDGEIEIKTKVKENFFFRIFDGNGRDDDDDEDDDRGRGRGDDDDDEDDEDEDDDDDEDKDHKILICHKGGFFNRTISIDKKALPAHLAHGDTEGRCTQNGPSDTTPPNITNLSAAALTSTTGSVSWKTNEASTGKVYYSTTTPVSLNTLVTSGTATTSHSVSLIGLLASTTYHFFVTATDVSGNTATSSTQSFLTLP